MRVYVRNSYRQKVDPCEREREGGKKKKESRKNIRRQIKNKNTMTSEENKGERVRKKESASVSVHGLCLRETVCGCGYVREKERG